MAAALSQHAFGKYTENMQDGVIQVREQTVILGPCPGETLRPATGREVRGVTDQQDKLLFLYLFCKKLISGIHFNSNIH